MNKAVFICRGIITGSLLCMVACASPGSPEENEERADTLSKDSSAAVQYPGEIPFDTLREDTTKNAEEEFLSAPPDYDSTRWTELRRLDPSIRNDLRYATDSNFVGEQLYECGRCFLRPEVAKAVVAAQQELQQQGLGLKMFDCYRPRPIQWKLWEKVPNPGYVADPRKGSVHNRGGAVDLTIIDEEGRPLDMGTPYDFFGRKAYHTYTGLADSVLANRRLLKNLMESHGFRSIRTEWWHYSYTKKNYPLSDMLWNCP